MATNNLSDKDTLRFMQKLYEIDTLVQTEPKYSIFKVVNNKNKPTNSKPNDLHPSLVQYAASVAHVFRQLEAASPHLEEVIKSAETYGRNVGVITKTMENDSRGHLKKQKVAFKTGFVQQYGNASPFTYLVNGMGQINKDNHLLGVSTDRTAYEKMIYYLHYFIALLDLSPGVKGKEIICDYSVVGRL